jgi:hypothetical protein
MNPNPYRLGIKPSIDEVTEFRLTYDCPRAQVDEEAES